MPLVIILTFSELCNKQEELVQISPAMYLHFVTTMSKSYVQNVGKIEEKRNRLEKVLHKLETIAGQVRFQI